MDTSSDKKRRSLLAVLLGCSLGVFALYCVFKSIRPIMKPFCARLLEEESPEGKGDMRLQPVEVEEATVSTIAKRIAVLGKVQANKAIKIKAETHARVKNLLFTEGGMVEEGQTIIQFEDASAIAEVHRCQANLSARTAELRRQQQLAKSRVGAGKDYDKALGDYQIAEAELEKAKAELAKMSIKAPFSGTIGIVKGQLTKGSYVQPGEELVTLVNSSPINIEFRVPEKFVSEVGVGQTAEIVVSAVKDRTFTAIVEAVDSTVEAESRSIALRASTPNEEGLLKPGLFAHVQLIVAERANAIMINEAALEREGDTEFVYIVDKGKAKRVQVLTGVRERGLVEVTAGLKAKDLVIIAGQMKLQMGGQRVKITNMPDPFEPKELLSKSSEPLPVLPALTQDSSSTPKPETAAAPESPSASKIEEDNSTEASDIPPPAGAQTEATEEKPNLEKK